MSTIEATIAQVVQPEFIEANAHVQTDVSIQIADSTIVLGMPLVVFNSIFWRIYVHFGIPITKDDIFWPDRSIDKHSKKPVYSFTSETVNNCLSKIYNDLVLKYNKDSLEVLSQVWSSLNAFTNFADKHTCEHQISLDAWSLAELCVQPPMKEVINRRLDGSHGAKFAEKQMDKITKDLMDVLGAEDILHDNCLKPLMRTKLLNRNQVPQMFGAFGPRSDITDEMMPWPISASAFGGLEDVKDYATESLSAKKAAFFNNSVISDAQYFARRCRLGASRLPKLYKGWCGSNVTIPFVIDPKFKKNFYGKYVKADDNTRYLIAKQRYRLYDDDSVELTPANIDMFTGRPIQMWSPFGCRHTDGVCEHCAGCMHQRLSAYVPPDICLGVFCATIAVSSVTQKILSAKHLIKTDSKEFVLPEATAAYFVKNGDAFIWSPSAAKTIKKLWVRFGIETFQGPLNDLTRKTLPTGVSFSKVDHIAIANDKNETVDQLPLSDGVTFPYFSSYLMKYMRTHFDKLRIDSDYIDVPMNDFDMSKPFLKYTDINDDMVSYVKRVDRFVSNDVRGYTSISSCLTDFIKVVFAKTDVAVFPLEMLLKGYLLDPSGKTNNAMVVTDPNEPVRFAGLAEVISTAALSTKLAFEGVNAFLEVPGPALRNLGQGWYDPLFNFASCS